MRAVYASLHSSRCNCFTPLHICTQLWGIVQLPQTAPVDNDVDQQALQQFAQPRLRWCHAVLKWLRPIECYRPYATYCSTLF